MIMMMTMMTSIKEVHSAMVDHVAVLRLGCQTCYRPGGRGMVLCAVDAITAFTQRLNNRTTFNCPRGICEVCVNR